MLSKVLAVLCGIASTIFLVIYIVSGPFFWESRAGEVFIYGCGFGFPWVIFASGIGWFIGDYIDRRVGKR